jgi:hypothetical protein
MGSACALHLSFGDHAHDFDTAQRSLYLMCEAIISIGTRNQLFKNFRCVRILRCAEWNAEEHAMR